MVLAHTVTITYRAGECSGWSRTLYHLFLFPRIRTPSCKCPNVVQFSTPSSPSRNSCGAQSSSWDNHHPLVRFVFEQLRQSRENRAALSLPPRNRTHPCVPVSRTVNKCAPVQSSSCVRERLRALHRDRDRSIGCRGAAAAGAP